MKHKKENIISMTIFAKVTDVNRGSVRVVNTDTNEELSIIGEELCDKCESADWFDNMETTTKTKIAEVLVSSWNKPFTVEFEKADKKIRTLRGRLVSTENLLGRSMVEDLDMPVGDNRIRLVDHRTIHSLIVDGVKYKTKD